MSTQKVKRMNTVLKQKVRETGLKRRTLHLGGEYEFAQEVAKDTPITGNALIRKTLRSGLVRTASKYIK